MRFSSVLTGALAVGAVSAHHGHDIDLEIAKREEWLSHSVRSVDHCAEKMKARGLEARAMQRRAQTAAKLAQARGVKAKRDVDDILGINHNRSYTGYTMNTPEGVLFASNKSCVLTPEGESGPYYVAGEYVRSNLVEDVQGVPVHYDFQVVDAATCEPLVGKFLEIFSCNSTGVYSGTTNDGNGNTADTSVLNRTFLRGLQPTDEEGVAQFDTIFPGHYTGRTNHIHTILHMNSTVRENNTVYDLTAGHIGQTFWDQSVVDQVELLYPYNTNTQETTTNAADKVFVVEAASSDPVFNYVMIGETLQDGLLGWLTLGINTTLGESTINPAAIYYATGGVEEA